MFLGCLEGGRGEGGVLQVIMIIIFSLDKAELGDKIQHFLGVSFW